MTGGMHGEGCGACVAKGACMAREAMHSWGEHAWKRAFVAAETVTVAKIGSPTFYT